VIEDSLNGLRAGLAAGMQVWRFTGGSHLAGIDLTAPPDATPHESYADFSTLRDSHPDLFAAAPVPCRVPS
jgi:beta-phosphoglucomutase-like phosphatase (HAD superfamily)